MNRIAEIMPRDNYTLWLRFDDGVEGTVDLSHLVGRGAFAAWNDPAVFGKARITEAGAVEWPGEIDLCPDSLYLKVTGKTPKEAFPSITDQANA